MPLSVLAQLVLLAAIWGASFLFTRIAAPVVGATTTPLVRLAVGALFLAVIGLLLNKKLGLRRHWRHYLFVGAFNSALPFYLYGVAALHTSASILSVANAVTPMWGALFAYLLGRQTIAPIQAAGFVFGLVGVGVLAAPGHVDGDLLIGVGCALVATAGYGVVSAYSAKIKDIDPFANAQVSMWAATLLLIPLLAVDPPQQIPTERVVLALLGLGVLCSGVAYLLYFRLIAEIGATATLSVTYLIPIFGMLWGALFLGEQLGWSVLVACVLICLATMMVNRLGPFRQPQQAG